MAATAPTLDTDLSRIYAEHFEYVWNNLRRMGVEWADLEDAVHDVFVVVHRRRDTFAGTSSMRTWLFGIARRIARTHRRGRFRHRRRLDAVLRALPPAAQRDPPQERAVDASVLDRFLASLDDGKRSVFILSELEQMTGREVAEALHINANTAASRLRAARRAFDDYTHQLRDADRLLVDDSPPVPARSRRRAWAMVLVDVGRPKAAATSATAAAVGHAKAVGISLTLGLGTLGVMSVVGPTLSGTPHASTTPATTNAGTVSTRVRTPGTREAPAVDRTAAELAAVQGPAPVVPSTSAAPTRAPRSPPSPPPVNAPGSATPAPSPAVATNTGPGDAPSLDEHNRRLVAARAALERADPTQARRLAEDYLQQFEHGFYADEMSLVHVQALGALGSCDQARTTARSLAARRPGTALARLASAVCNPRRADSGPSPIPVPPAITKTADPGH
ncbi:MAG: sigma-70 family RNA polymerase sigma factor [Deltaproteobacteria bacterium]|nr:sigma-70 family RNA polymerase sigma factor [Deltaproteobacteria bacterium]